MTETHFVPTLDDQMVAVVDALIDASGKEASLAPDRTTFTLLTACVAKLGRLGSCVDVAELLRRAAIDADLAGVGTSGRALEGIGAAFGESDEAFNELVDALDGTITDLIFRVADQTGTTPALATCAIFQAAFVRLLDLRGPEKLASLLGRFSEDAAQVALEESAAAGRA